MYECPTLIITYIFITVILMVYGLLIIAEEIKNNKYFNRLMSFAILLLLIYTIVSVYTLPEGKNSIKTHDIVIVNHVAYVPELNMNATDYFKRNLTSEDKVQEITYGNFKHYGLKWYGFKKYKLSEGTKP